MINSHAIAPKLIVVLNAGALIYLGGITDNIKDGILLARKCISDGRALNTLEKAIQLGKE